MIARLALIKRLVAEHARYRMALEAVVIETNGDYSSAAEKAGRLALQALAGAL